MHPLIVYFQAYSFKPPGGERRLGLDYAHTPPNLFTLRAQLTMPHAGMQGDTVGQEQRELVLHNLAMSTMQNNFQIDNHTTFLKACKLVARETAGFDFYYKTRMRANYMARLHG